ncbi:cytochrome b561 and DOMON domain-containing protein At3g61750-like isoform X1 [Ananas comosus]|uniref:Cytochrome b561 and DOMON domain-containing protein At3g61750-like isoform X1 n=2 Tax=Ananas comosus TaxID=4615 RepID=A0A6P5FTW9_ANACO|nr:cytochrome b561 and DOMON domain-containing protein At3g61750-like isoform X1 [Ananas comosus]
MSPAFSLLALTLALSAAIGAVCSQINGCSADLSAFLPAPFNVSGLSCRPMWNSFILRHSQNQDNILSIVLSSPYTSGWVGIAFSNDGMMTGSSAMVGWIGNEGRAYIKQFYLGGQTSSQAVVNKGNLLLSSDAAPSVVLYGASIYLAFQLKFQAPVTRQALLFAYSTTPPMNYRLTEHDDKTSVSFDFSPGASASTSTSPSSSSSSSFYPYELKRNHGALAMFGWGVLLPVGAIVARYFRRRDPLWYHLHVIIQFVGFLIGLAGAVAGIALYNRVHSNFTTHRGLGVFILVLGSLQVIAFFLRPDKESKIRKYWNWYHHWVGRLALFLAAVNIALGIQIGGAGDTWKAVYGILLAVILISVTVLEIAFWVR